MESYPRVWLYRRLVKAKLYIDQFYSNDIDLNQIAGEVYCSKFHFIRQFKEIYGSTPHQYLISVRIAKARELLASGYPVMEVCGAVGFESVSSFTSLFKKLNGQTPAVWQANEIERLSNLRDRPLHYIPGCFGLRQDA